MVALAGAKGSCMTRRSFVAGMGAVAAAASARRLAGPRLSHASEAHELPDGHIVVSKSLVPYGGEGEPAPLAGVVFAARRIYSEAERAAMAANDASVAGRFAASAAYKDGETYSASAIGAHLPDVAGSFSGFMFLEGDAWLEAATGEDGRADISTGQSFGTFILVEDAASSAAAGSVTLIEPCVVNLPAADEEGRALYTVEARPKNRELGRGKAIELEGGELAAAASLPKGAAVRYAVDGELPFNVDGLVSYVIRDEVDPRLEIARVLSLACSTGYAGGAASTDEEVVEFVEDTGGGGDYTASWSGQELTVSLKAGSIRSKVIAPGLMTDRLVDGDKSLRTSTVRLRFECALRGAGASEAAAGDYPNTATVSLVNGSGTSYEAETGEAHVYNVKIQVNKRSPAGAPLAGAVFGIADSLEHARANPALFLSETMDGQGGAVGPWAGDDTATTGADGSCVFSGLPFDLDEGADYWVRELSAPAGYGIVAEPIRVHVGGLDESRAAGFAYAVEVTDSPAGFLPTTGGVRSYAGIAAGAALAAGGAAAAVAAGRRGGARAGDDGPGRDG